jgi:hypothetical protein
LPPDALDELPLLDAEEADDALLLEADDEEEETSPLLPPLADETLPLLPPLVDETLPPLEVDEMTMLPLDPPPPKPPPKPPPNPPPKKPPLPPTTTGMPPPPPETKPSPTGAGTGTGVWLATVTTVGAQTVRVVVVTTRRFGFVTDATRTGRCTTRLVILVLTVRLGVSAICTAPPPITAPPQAHAHNFAKAIRTDISSLSRCWRWRQIPVHGTAMPYPTKCKTNH